MLTKRIIPCLDVKDGRAVKGVNFEGMRDVGDPVAMATYYAQQLADELVFLDISATDEKRKTFADLVKRIAQNINIPFTVGGGISTVADVTRLLESGADKVSINTAAIKNPKLIKELARNFGSQCIVLAIDTKFEDNKWVVYANGGKKKTDLLTYEWVKEITQLGAGEILLTSISNDGTKSGYAIKLTHQVSACTHLPVIASGGAGCQEHFSQVFLRAGADAALAAGIFHSKELTIPGLKQYLNNNKINVRL